jgi:hypothetical protein
MTLRQMLMATILTLSFVTLSFGGTITGSRSNIAGSRTGTITGSRTGTITGSRTGTITGSRATPNHQGSRTSLQDDLLSRVMLFMLAGSW